MNDISLKNIDIIALIIALLPFSRVIKFVPGAPVGLYYGALILMGIILFCKEQYKIFDIKVVLFLAACALSLVLNVVDPRYRAWERLIGLFGIILTLGPLFVGVRTQATRIECLKYISWLSIFTCVASFALFIVARSLTYTERGNLYGGITVHSMILGPIAALATMYMVQFAFLKYRDLTGIQKMLTVILTLICLFNCIMAGSRSALGGLVVSVILWLWIFLSDNRRLFFKCIIAISVGTAATSPLWWQYTETIQKKMAVSESNGSMLYSRQARWDARIIEIQNNPIVGMGFGTVDAPVSSKGTVEPGNGWLFIWSSAGIVAFIMFCIIYLQAIVASWRSRTYIGMFVLSLLTFFAIHINAEGYSISSGHLGCLMMWLCLGIGRGFKYLES